MEFRKFFYRGSLLTILFALTLGLCSVSFASKAKVIEPEIVNPPVVDASGGPDGFGYVWRDNDNEPTGPVYNWRDISTTGTNTNVTGDDAISTTAHPIGFNFSFYGTNYTSFKVCTNGWMTLNANETSVAYSNVAIPNAATPNLLIAPFWDDLYVDNTVGHYIRYQNFGTDTLVVTWNTRAFSSSVTGTFTFQVILTSSGHIYFQYNSLGSVTNSATIGIENATGTVGLQIAFNAAYAVVGRAVRINLANPQNYGTLTGIVTAANNPLAGANVTIMGINRSTMTNNQGNYTINNVDPGTYSVRFSAFGYPDTVYTGIVITGGQTTTRNHNWPTQGLSFNSPSVPVNIVDNDTARAQILIANGFLVADVNVLVDITHTWDADLTLILRSPTGVNVVLAQNVGGSGDNFTQTIFDDEATTPIASGTPPFTGSFIPANPLSALDGSNSAGTWWLLVYDGASGDIGTINQFSLSFTTGTGSYVRGTVTRAGQAVDSARVQIGANVTFTNTLGQYGMQSLTGQFPVTVTKPGYNTFTGNVTIGADTTTYNIVMTRPIAVASPTSIEMQVNYPNSGSANVTLTNNGDGPLSWNAAIHPGNSLSSNPSVPNNVTQMSDEQLRLVTEFALPFSSRPTTPPEVDEPDTLWQPLLTINVDPLNGSQYNYGVEVVNGYIYVSAGQKFYRFNAQGALVDSLTIGGAPAANFNVRDMAYDGDYIYGGWDASFLRAFNPTTGAQVSTANIPLTQATFALPRGVAYDPETDHFFVGNWSNNYIKRITRTGTVLATWNIGGVGGLAWDPNGQGGYKLYVALDGANQAHLAKLNVNNTATLDTLTLRSPLPGSASTDICAGLTLSDELIPGFWTLVALVQGNPDRVFVYEFGVSNTRWSLTPTSGSVNPGQNNILSVTFTPQQNDPSGLYNADLRITWNPTDDIITIPIQVTLVTSANDNTTTLPLKYELMGSYPNPFNSETKVKFSLADRSQVNLALYNINGQKVAELFNAEMPAGVHTVGLRAIDLPTGTYFVRMETAKYVGVSKVVLLK
ncbi:MAG: carboxypeptidase regulatory-like domain-containing protein [bacterium]|nr:carboxypeptidase regulatory-like domain-containing protein [bacterium]